MAGDQQAATFGQCCFQPGQAKNTYGTGCFMLLNTGDQPVFSDAGMLTTVGWRIGNEIRYCLEGSIFVAGAAVQWLRDGIGIIQSAAEIEQLAASVEDSGGVYFVPAFVGLGAPHWDSSARGTIVGLTRGTTRAHLARATLESIAHQTCDVLDAMSHSATQSLTTLRVDGGASANNLLLQMQADRLGVSVVRPTVQETTARGAAYLAGLAVGVWESQTQLQQFWQQDRQFDPDWSGEQRQADRAVWQRAVQRSLRWLDDDQDLP
jgi:glycerol kinase